MRTEAIRKGFPEKGALRLNPLVGFMWDKEQRHYSRENVNKYLVRNILGRWGQCGAHLCFRIKQLQNVKLDNNAGVYHCKS